MNICVTGSNGLIGSSVCKLFCKDHTVLGIDNNMRKAFFGEDGSTVSQLTRLSHLKNYTHKNIDIRDRHAIRGLFETMTIDAVIHCAAQPSHDLAKQMIGVDFEVNTMGTLNILEALHNTNKNGVFIFMSTNKVYGDNPNKVDIVEEKTRYVFKDSTFKGFNETCSIDNSTHSFFGASKLAADIYTQEYGHYLGLRTTVLRLGCVTGSHHAGVKLHGFLSFLIKSLIKDNAYEIIGYKGKQVRDQIHADDVATACLEILKKPTKGDVFNMGGGKKNSASILELISMVSKKTLASPRIRTLDTPRIGDHICYITDTSKFKAHFPSWRLSRPIESIVDELIAYEQSNR
jgi:CDP-paratose 2-epimerase